MCTVYTRFRDDSLNIKAAFKLDIEIILYVYNGHKIVQQGYNLKYIYIFFRFNCK